MARCYLYFGHFADCEEHLDKAMERCQLFNLVAARAGTFETYGNLYSDLLNYVVFAALLFYVLTIIGIFVLRAKRPDAERPYRAFGYPFVPVLYIVAAVAIMLVLLLYQTQTSGKGLEIVLIGVPVYVIWSWWSRRAAKLRSTQ